MNLNLSLFFLLWPSLDSILLNNFNRRFNLEISEKLTINTLSFIHCIGYLLLATYHFFYQNILIFKLSCDYSISYYFWDIFRIYLLNRNNQLSFGDKGYIYHHLIAIIVKVFLLSSNNLKIDIFNLKSNIGDLLYTCYILAEYSNIPIFLVYYKIKINPDYYNDKKKFTSILKAKYLQFIVYFFIRCIYFTYVIYKHMNLLKIDNLFKDIIRNIGIFSIYFMSNIWLFKQLINIIKDTNLYFTKKIK